MPKLIYPQSTWDTELIVPVPGEPRNIGPLETLFQRLANRTEWLRQSLDAVLAGFGGTTLDAHRTAVELDHPDRSVTRQKLAVGAVGADEIADGAVIAAKIADGAVIAAKIAPGAVEGSAIADGAIEARHLTPSAISANMDFKERFVLTTRSSVTSLSANTFTTVAVYAVNIPSGKRLVIKRWRRYMNATVPISWGMQVNPSTTLYTDAPGNYGAELTPNYPFPDTGVEATIAFRLRNSNAASAGLSHYHMLWVELALESI